MRKNKNHRTCTVLIACLIAAISLSAGCGRPTPNDPEAPPAVSKSAILEDFAAILALPRSGENYPDAVNAYIIERATEIGCEIQTDGNGNVIADLPPTPGRENTPLTLLHTHTGEQIAAVRDIIFNPETNGIFVDTGGTDGLIQNEDTSMGASSAVGIATLLNTLEISNNHGPLRAIFTADSNTADDMAGAINLNSSLLDGATLINVNAAQTNTLYTGAVAAAILAGGGELIPSTTAGKRAYVIAASGFPGGQAALQEDGPESGATLGKEILSGGGDTLNPISFITEVLTSAANSGLFYELCAIDSGAAPLQIPTEASCIVTVNEYEEARLRQIVDDTGKSYLSAAAGLPGGEDAEIAMIETQLPPTAVSSDDASKAITFLFSLLSSNFTGSKGEAADLCMGNVTLRPDRFSCAFTLLAEDKETIDAIVSEQTNVEKLTSFVLRVEEELPGWITDTDSETAAALLDAYAAASGNDCKTAVMSGISELGYFSKKNANLLVFTIGPQITDRGLPGETLTRTSVNAPANAIIRFLGQDHYPGTE